MAEPKSFALARGVALAAAVAFGSAPAFAQNNPNGAEAYRAGVVLGRTLHNPGQCDGSGDYRQGCLDGVEESRFDREADQALRSDTSDAKPSERAPPLSPPPDLFRDPYNRPGDGGPPND